MLADLFFILIKSCNNMVMNFLYEVFGKYELLVLLKKYDITGICSPYCFRLLAHNECVLRLSFLCSYACSCMFFSVCVCCVFCFVFYCCHHGEIKFIKKFVLDDAKLSPVQ